MSSMIDKTYITIFLLIFSLTLNSQSIDGAWETVIPNDNGQEMQHVAIISNGFVSEAFFEKDSGKFMGTWGGSYEVKDGNFNCTYEFSTFDSQLVGTSQRLEFKLINGKMHLEDKVWTRIDDGSPGVLNGAWLISGRMRDGEIQQRDTNRPRKTMKILSGTRFQWIAYNTETKEFMGTGGGAYTSENGKYVENIGFFSRDDSRVGASLSFDFTLEDGNWHHSGKSSKGSPIYEIWSPRKQ